MPVRGTHRACSMQISALSGTCVDDRQPVHPLHCVHIHASHTIWHDVCSCYCISHSLRCPASTLTPPAQRKAVPQALRSLHNADMMGAARLTYSTQVVARQYGCYHFLQHSCTRRLQCSIEYAAQWCVSCGAEKYVAMPARRAS